MNKLDKIKIRKQLKQIENVLKEKMKNFNDIDYINAIESDEVINEKDDNLK